MSLILIGFIAALGVSITLTAKNPLLSVAVSSVVYYIIPIVIYGRIKDQKILKSLLLLIGLVVFIFLAYYLNPENKITLIAIAISAVIPYTLSIRIKHLVHARRMAENKSKEV